jgi:uncharacterized membrane-anchored protein YitT (DUF2179 family)
MVDKTGLQIIGFIFGGTTAAVALVAMMLVGNAMASGGATGGEDTALRLVTIAPQH